MKLEDLHTIAASAFADEYGTDAGGLHDRAIKAAVNAALSALHKDFAIIPRRASENDLEMLTSDLSNLESTTSTGDYFFAGIDVTADNVKAIHDIFADRINLNFPYPE